MSTNRSLCAACQNFISHLFDPTPPVKVEPLHLHKNFTELSKCAVELCDLCQFIRREYCFYSAGAEHYKFPNHVLKDDSKTLSIELFFLDRQGKNPVEVEKRAWTYYHGDSPGPSHKTDQRWVKNVVEPPTAFGNHTDVDKLLVLARNWLTSCIGSHATCDYESRKRPRFLPTRLLEVGTTGRPFIHLVVSEDLPPTTQMAYATLSYCWGPGEHSSSTTSTNYGARLKSLVVASLPKTFVDAVEIVRALRIQYLWIDALCIIQPENGDMEDWQREFPIMGKIYQNSILTIAASGAEHKDAGCFYRREPACWPVKNYILEDTNQELGKDNSLVLEAAPPAWNLSVENSPLAQRGWVLQERMLAARTLFCTQDGLFWECTELHASEYVPTGGTPVHKDFPSPRELVGYMHAERSDRRNGQKAWVNVLQQFSQKGLSELWDKLPALAGLANELASRTGQEFELGMWRLNLVEELAWAADFTLLETDEIVDPPSTRIPGFPSWSWASKHQKLHFRPGQFRDMALDTVQVEIIKPQTATLNAASGYRLEVRGRMGQLRVQKLGYGEAVSDEPAYNPTPCAFERVREISSSDLDPDPFMGETEVILFDTLADALPESGGLVTCIRWMRWAAKIPLSESRRFMDDWCDDFIYHR